MVFLSFCDAPPCRLRYSRTPLTLTLKANKQMIRVSGGSSQLIVNHKKTGSKEIGCRSGWGGVGSSQWGFYCMSIWTREKKYLFLFDTLRKEKARPLSQLESLTLSQDKLKEVFQVKDATRSR